MIREILKMGDPRLLRVAPAVPDAMFGSAELDALIADMFDTMHDAGGVGLAAPQIGVDLQLVIFGFDSSDRYPDAPAVPRTILLNPVITPLSQDMEEGWEGCLSVPGLRGAVNRYTLIRYQGFDPKGAQIDRTAEGFHARVVQHEAALSVADHGFQQVWVYRGVVSKDGCRGRRVALSPIAVYLPCRSAPCARHPFAPVFNFVISAKAGRSAKRGERPKGGPERGERSESPSSVRVQLSRSLQRAAYDRSESLWDAAGVSISCRRREASPRGTTRS